METLMTVKGLAEYLQVSKRQVYRLIADGLPAVRLGPRCLRFRVADVDEWIGGLS
jgi:excisionase family DNA binding protein